MGVEGSEAPGETVPVGLLGASGLVGQVLALHLLKQKKLEIAFLGASDARAGEPATSVLGPRAASLPPLSPLLPMPAEASSWPLVFSALPSEVARKVEPLWAEKTIVVSNASAFRADPRVPLVIPEVNAHHIEPLLAVQRRELGWKGLVTNPNCAVIPVVMSLAPLRSLGLEQACLTTFQSLSGAGRDGPPALEALGNLLPDIPGEAPKIATEPLKLLGGPAAPLSDFVISAATCRVPVKVGHLVHCRVRFRQVVDEQEILSRWRDMVDLHPTPHCPRPLEVLDRPPRPSDLEPNDLRVLVGGLAPDAVLGVQYWVLADNLARGAALAAWLNGLSVLEIAPS